MLNIKVGRAAVRTHVFRFVPSSRVQQCRGSRLVADQAGTGSKLSRWRALVGVIAPIIQKPAITAITALPAGGYRNNSNSNSNSLFLSAPGPRKAAASLLLGQRVAIPGSCPVCQLASAAGATTCAPLPLTPPAPDARRPLPATRRITPPPTPRAHSDSRRARPQAWRRRQHLRHKRFCTSSSSRNQHGQHDQAAGLCGFAPRAVCDRCLPTRACRAFALP